MIAGMSAHLSARRPGFPWLAARGAGSGVLSGFMFGLAVLMMSQLGVWFERAAGGGIGPIMPGAGLALAGALILPVSSSIPAIYLGVLLSNFMAGSTLWEANTTAAATLAGTLFGRTVFIRWLAGDSSLGTLKDFVKFAISGCVVMSVFVVLTRLAFEGAAGAFPIVSELFDLYQALALGALVFGIFGLFALRRQDLRPQDLRGAYEMLLYSALLAWCLYHLLTNPDLADPPFFALLAGSFLLTLVVSLRFGLRPAALFLVMFVFLIPAFTLMFPQRISLQYPFLQAEARVGHPGIFALLGTLGCMLLGAFRDELVALRVKFNLAMASADMCVWEWSDRGWSCHTDSWCEKFGLLPGCPAPMAAVFNLVHPDDLPGFESSFAEVLAGRAELWTHSYRMRSADGRWIWVQSRAQMLQKTADDDVSVVAGVTRDITEERQAVQARIVAIQNEAELKTLRSQLNPHFLFNSLNSIRALIGRCDEKARTMTTSLSNLLRDLLSLRGDITHPLHKELDIVQTYLGIESIRYGERLAYEIDADPAAGSLLIPGMMIQTLVENAVKHGVSKRDGGGRVSVRVRLTPPDGALQISVLNDGELGGPSGGFGVENTKRRIALATGGRGTLSLIGLPGPKVEATVVIPAPASSQTTHS